MAATFTQITLEEIDVYLKRAFRALRPKPGPVVRGEVTRVLTLSDKVFIRIYTSVGQGSDMAAGEGADAIRVGLFGPTRPLLAGKLPIVKRTQGWRDNLRERVEDMMELYDDREGYWESRAV